MFDPRPYQQRCFDVVKRLMKHRIGDLPELKKEIPDLFFKINEGDDLNRPIKKIMVVSPPRSGKGSVAMKFAADAYNAGSKVLSWVHRNELVEDLGERLSDQMGVPKNSVGYIMSGVKQQESARIQMASVMTAIRRDLDWFEPKIRITDECHRLLSGSQRKLEELHPDSYLLGFTATPYRLGKNQDFSEIFDCGIQLVTYMELEEKRFLVPVTVYEPAGIASMEGVRIRMGDYVQSDLEKKFMEERLYGALFKEWKMKTGGTMPTAIYNVSKKHNDAVADFFRRRGVNVAVIDDSTPKKDKWVTENGKQVLKLGRRSILKKFQKGIFCEDPIMVLCSIAVLVEGFDAPAMLCSVLNYRTKSKTKFLQSALRVNTPYWNKDRSDWYKLPSGKYYKDKCIILDMGGNTRLHGMIETYDAFGFTMDGKPKEGQAPTKRCPGVEDSECDRIIYASAKVCPHCGYEFPIKPKEDKKKFVDEVGMQEVKRDRHWKNVIIKMSTEQVWGAHPGFLRTISAVRGFQSQWAYHVCVDRGLYNAHDGSSDGWKEFYKWIYGQEKKVRMDKVYERLKKQSIKI